jgi:hypothetical protein
LFYSKGSFKKSGAFEIKETEVDYNGKRATWSCNQLTHSKIETKFTNIAFI